MNFTFDPYVGCCYGKSESLFNKKIIVVGASHYYYCCEKCMKQYFLAGNKTAPYALLSSNCETEEHLFTKKVVESYIQGKLALSSYTKFINAVLNFNSSPCDRKDFFSSAIFYNYLQEIEGVNANDKHPEKFCDEKRKARDLYLFKELLSVYTPDVVLVWGSNVWNALPEELEEKSPRQKVDDSKINMRDRIWDYSFGKKIIRFCACLHPSYSRFNKQDHRQMFDLCGIEVKKNRNSAFFCAQKRR